jgi:anaerobic selenocysteine-containing dehydrogenase
VHGTLCQWLIQLITIATGNLDRVGGSLVTLPAFDLVGGPGFPGSYGKRQSRVSGYEEILGEFPAVALAEEILTPGDGQIRALVTMAANPVLSNPNGRKLDEALSQLDFMVSIDIYINETTRHADVILPPTSGLEHDHYDMVFNMFAVRNVARFNEAVMAPTEGALHDWQILQGLGSALAAKLGESLKPLPAPDVFLDFALKAGPYKLSLAQLKETPHQLDLGPLKPSFPERLATPDKRIHCAPDPLMKAVATLDSTLFAGMPDDQILLIGRRHLRSNNSWMHNYRRLVKGKDRCQLYVHPTDVARLGLTDGQKVRLRSRTGAIEVNFVATDEVMPGVVSLPHGWGHGRKGIRMATASEFAGVSINDVTDETLIDRVSGNAALNGVPVTLELVEP